MRSRAICRWVARTTGATVVAAVVLTAAPSATLAAPGPVGAARSLRRAVRADASPRSVEPGATAHRWAPHATAGSVRSRVRMPPTPVAERPFAVARETILVTDPSRPPSPRAAKGTGTAGTDHRTLRVELRTPAGARGLLPLVVFAHGFDSEPARYSALLNAWTALGYVVAAPETPESAHDLPGEPRRDAILEQTKDVSAVVTSMLDGYPSIDRSRIAVAGHSDGGSSVAALALDADLADPRIDAYLVLSGAVPDDAGGRPSGDPHGDLLVVVGDADEFGDLGASEEVYREAALTKELDVVPGGDHAGMYTGSSPLESAVIGSTKRFLDRIFAGH